MSHLQRNDQHRSDLLDDEETGSNSDRKLEGMRDGDDSQDDVFIVELEKKSSGIGLGLIDGLVRKIANQNTDFNYAMTLDMGAILIMI